MSEEDEKITYKFILIGDSSVGKTCLFKKMTTGNFNDKNISTIGVDRKSLSINTTVLENGVEKNKNFEIQLWDTAGQERFRSITKSYYKESQGLFLLYDITNRESFEGLNKWVTGIRESLGEKSDKYAIILLGNKLDLVNEDADARKVTEDDAEKECKNFDIIWGGECSAKDFTHDELVNLFTKYTKEIYKKIGVVHNKDSQTTVKCSSVKTKNKKDCAC